MITVKSPLENPNLMVPDGQIQRDESVIGISLRCPHCSHLGSFYSRSTGLRYPKYYKGQSKTQGLLAQAFLYVCPNSKCNGIVSVVSASGFVLRSFPPEKIDFDGENLPAGLQETLSEAIACHAAGAYRAAAMMVRRLLEEFCVENGVQGKDLHAKLIALKEKITMPQELFDAMGELKALGNDAAHVAAKNFAIIGEDESKDSIELVKEILKARYQLKNLVERLRSRRSPPEKTP